MNDKKKKVKIRFRQIMYQKPTYGRFDEYQVVEGRKILSRHDLEWHAVEWCEKNGCEIISKPSKD